jgi:dUTP pyrophosphatase
MIIRFKKLTPDAKTPVKTYDVDAGFDMFAATKTETNDYVEYKTGIAFEIPEGYVGLVFPRSSVTKKDLILKNCVGVIDASYRGEVQFRFHGVKTIHFSAGTNLSYNSYGSNVYEIGDRIGQVVFVEIPKITLEEADELTETERGDGGFGSTGIK